MANIYLAMLVKVKRDVGETGLVVHLYVLQKCVCIQIQRSKKYKKKIIADQFSWFRVSISVALATVYTTTLNIRC